MLQRATELEFGFNQLPVTSVEIVWFCGVGAWAGIAPRQKAFDKFDILGMADIESAVIGVSHNAIFIDQETVRYYLETEAGAQQSIGIDQNRVCRTGRNHKRASDFCTLLVKSNRDEFELVGGVKLSESLPPGQLFTASSPGTPHIQETAFSPQVSE